MALSPSQRKQRAVLAAHTSWAHTSDPQARTAPGRRAFLSRFEREVDPDGRLPEAERLRRAESARRAYFARLALRSLVARTKKVDPAGRRAESARKAEAARLALRSLVTGMKKAAGAIPAPAARAGGADDAANPTL